ncbi:MAG TPA: metal-dependent phosphohydrolase [Patescibacteria group bacterium]|nr:metal-dependent phosphohydrolase [Patescibacteria group bacterium]
MDDSLFKADCNRRDFLKMSAGAAVALSAMALPVMPVGAAPGAGVGKKITMAECMKLDAAAMAERSVYVKGSYEYLTKTVSLINDRELRETVVTYLKNPAPRLLERYSDGGSKEAVRQQLVNAGYLKPENTVNQFLPAWDQPQKMPQPFYTAPGSGYGSHHSYPGGLSTHVAVNVKASLAFFDAYQDIYGYRMNKDIIVAAQMMHDFHKPWVFQWQEDGSSLPETPIAGTGSHHILSIAEALYRGFDPELVVAMACAHTHPGFREEEVQLVNWLKAAAMLAGQDPVRYGVLAPGGDTVPLPRRQEGFITHLGDHDFVLTVPAAQWLIGKLGEIAGKEYGMSAEDLKSAKFNHFRNYIFSQVTIKSLHHIWLEKGESGLTETVQALVTA